MYGAVVREVQTVDPAVAASTETPTATGTRWVRGTSLNGRRAASCFIRANSGDSSRPCAAYRAARPTYFSVITSSIWLPSGSLTKAKLRLSPRFACRAHQGAAVGLRRLDRPCRGSATSRMSDAIAPAGASFGRVAITMVSSWPSWPCQPSSRS